MAGYNQITIVGNLTKDPDIKDAAGTTVCTINVAVNRLMNKNAKEGAQTVDYFQANVWGQRGENCHKFLKKGSQVLVVGKMQIRPYEDKNGVKKIAAEILADDVQFLDRRGEGGGSSTSGETHAEISTGAPSGTSLDDSEIPF